MLGGHAAWGWVGAAIHSKQRGDMLVRVGWGGPIPAGCGAAGWSACRRCAGAVQATGSAVGWSQSLQQFKRLNCLPSCQPPCTECPKPKPTPATSHPCSQKLDGPYDNRVLPVVLTCVLMTFLTVVWVGSIISYMEGGK